MRESGREGGGGRRRGWEVGGRIPRRVAFAGIFMDDSLEVWNYYSHESWNSFPIDLLLCYKS